MKSWLCAFLAIWLAGCFRNDSTSSPDNPWSGKWIRADEAGNPPESAITRVVEFGSDSMRYHTLWGDCFYQNGGYPLFADSMNVPTIWVTGDTLYHQFNDFSVAEKFVRFEKPACFKPERLLSVDGSINLNGSRDTVHIEGSYSIQPLPGDSVDFYSVVTFGIFEFPGCERHTDELPGFDGEMRKSIPFTSLFCHPGASAFSVNVEIGFKHRGRDSMSIRGLGGFGKALP